MSVELLPLCSIPKVATREGHTGANAYANRIGTGPWYANGQVASNLNDRAPQDKSRTFQGSYKPDTFSKNGIFEQAKIAFE